MKGMPFERACDSPNVFRRIADGSRSGKDNKYANIVPFSLKNPKFWNSDRHCAKRAGHVKCEGKKGEERKEGKKQEK
jgi:hypothetical protein